MLHRLQTAWPERDRYLIITKDALGWRGDPGLVHFDFVDFERALSEGRFEDALTAYGGDLLPEESAGWIVAERERLRTAYLDALACAAAALAQSDPRGALGHAERLVQADPLREGAIRTRSPSPAT